MNLTTEAQEELAGGLRGGSAPGTLPPAPQPLGPPSSPGHPAGHQGCMPPPDCPQQLAADWHVPKPQVLPPLPRAQAGAAGHGRRRMERERRLPARAAVQGRAAAAAERVTISSFYLHTPGRPPGCREALAHRYSLNSFPAGPLGRGTENRRGGRLRGPGAGPWGAGPGGGSVWTLPLGHPHGADRSAQRVLQVRGWGPPFPPELLAGPGKQPRLPTAA